MWNFWAWSMNGSKTVRHRKHQKRRLTTDQNETVPIDMRNDNHVDDDVWDDDCGHVDCCGTSFSCDSSLEDNDDDSFGGLSDSSTLVLQTEVEQWDRIHVVNVRHIGINIMKQEKLSSVAVPLDMHKPDCYNEKEKIVHTCYT